MNYKDFNRIKKNDNCLFSSSVGMFGCEIYAFEMLIGMSDVPIYYQITKAEFDTFDIWQEDTGFIMMDIKNRKCLCSAEEDYSEIDMKNILSEAELDKAMKNRTLWKSYTSISDAGYDGKGTVTFDFKAYKLTKKAYEDEINDDFTKKLWNKTLKSKVWNLAYSEILGKKVKMGTYCETIKCPSCNHEFYFCDVFIPDFEKYETICPECKAKIMKKKIKD